MNTTFFVPFVFVEYYKGITILSRNIPLGIKKIPKKVVCLYCDESEK